ncbi:MAG: hypothetical protein J0H69_00820 [Burkholderiales bacterium]|nr:hypothetical protein [Burkholderiales bacterium]
MVHIRDLRDSAGPQHSGFRPSPQAVAGLPNSSDGTQTSIDDRIAATKKSRQFASQAIAANLRISRPAEPTGQFWSLPRGSDAPMVSAGAARFDPLLHGTRRDYVRSHRAIACAAFDQQIGRLKNFAAEHHLPDEAREQLRQLGRQSTGELRGTIRQVPDETLFCATLECLDRIVDAVFDETIPGHMRKGFVQDLCRQLDVCGGGVHNAVDRAARIVEQRRNGLPGIACLFRQDVLEQVALEHASTDIGPGSETHWVRACVAALAREMGVRMPQEDLTVVYPVAADVQDLIRREARKLCTPSALIRHMAAQIAEHVRAAFADYCRQLNRTPQRVSLDELGVFGERMENEIKAEFCMEDLSSGLILHAMFALSHTPVSDEPAYTLHGRQELIQLRVQDALQRCGLVKASPVMLSELPGGRSLEFDGERIYVSSPFGLHFAQPDDLRELNPQAFGSRAEDLVMAVIGTCDPDDLQDIPPEWITTARTLHAWFGRTGPQAPEVLNQLAIDRLLREADDAGKTQLLQDLLRNGASITDLVRQGRIDCKADQSDLLASLISNGLFQHARELIRLGARRAFYKQGIQDDERNPLVCALRAADRQLFDDLHKAGWTYVGNVQVSAGFTAPGTQPGYVDKLIDAGNEAALRLMLDMKLIDRKNTVLASRAMEAGHSDMALKLLDEQAILRAMGINDVFNRERNPLIAALQHLNVAGTAQLIELWRRTHGDMAVERLVNSKFRLGDETTSPLQYAIFRNDAAMVSYLLAVGAIMGQAEYAQLREQRNAAEVRRVIEAHAEIRREQGRRGLK